MTQGSWLKVRLQPSQTIRPAATQNKNVDAVLLIRNTNPVRRKQSIIRPGESIDLRHEMVERGFTASQLAAMAHVGPRRISNVLTGNDASWPIRAAINKHLGQQMFRKPSIARPRKSAGPKKSIQSQTL